MPVTSMWTISEVNYRDGATTDYAKIGTLKENEEVTVNGKASTGWYRFVLEDGTEAYVSDKYLTTDDPNTATEDTEEEPEETEAAPAVEPEPEPAVEVPEPVVEAPEHKVSGCFSLFYCVESCYTIYVVQPIPGNGRRWLYGNAHVIANCDRGRRNDTLRRQMARCA